MTGKGWPLQSDDFAPKHYYDATTFSDIQSYYWTNREDRETGRTKRATLLIWIPTGEEIGFSVETNWRVLLGRHSLPNHISLDMRLGSVIYLCSLGGFEKWRTLAESSDFKRGAFDRHVFFGSLEVREVWPLGMDRNNAFAKPAPHITTESLR